MCGCNFHCEKTVGTILGRKATSFDFRCPGLAKSFLFDSPPFDACFTPVWVPNAQLPFDPTIYSERTFAVFDGSLEIIET